MSCGKTRLNNSGAGCNWLIKGVFAWESSYGHTKPTSRRRCGALLKSSSDSNLICKSAREVSEGRVSSRMVVSTMALLVHTCEEPIKVSEVSEMKCAVDNCAMR